MRSHELAIMRIGHYSATTANKASSTKLINQTTLRSTLMLTLLVDGVLQMQTMQTMFYHELVLLFVMLTALWYGAANFRLKLHYWLLRPNTLPCLMLFVIPFRSRTLSMRLAAFFCCRILSQFFASQFMRTIFLLFPWQNHFTSHLAQNILPSNIITFAAGFKHPSTNQVISGSSIFQQSSNLLTSSISWLTMIFSSNFDISCVDGGSY